MVQDIMANFAADYHLLRVRIIETYVSFFLQ